MNIEIRKFTESEIPAYVELWRQAENLFPIPCIAGKLYSEKKAKEELEEVDLFCRAIAFYGSRPVGSVDLLFIATSILSIHRFLVLPPHQNKEIGLQLFHFIMQYLLNHLKDASHIVSIETESWASNQPVLGKFATIFGAFELGEAKYHFLWPRLFSDPFFHNFVENNGLWQSKNFFCALRSRQSGTVLEYQLNGTPEPIVANYSLSPDGTYSLATIGDRKVGNGPKQITVDSIAQPVQKKVGQFNVILFPDQKKIFYEYGCKRLAYQMLETVGPPFVHFSAKNKTQVITQQSEYGLNSKVFYTAADLLIEKEVKFFPDQNICRVTTFVSGNFAEKIHLKKMSRSLFRRGQVLIGHKSGSLIGDIVFNQFPNFLEMDSDPRSYLFPCTAFYQDNLFLVYVCKSKNIERIQYGDNRMPDLYLKVSNHKEKRIQMSEELFYFKKFTDISAGISFLKKEGLIPHARISDYKKIRTHMSKDDKRNRHKNNPVRESGVSLSTQRIQVLLAPERLGSIRSLRVDDHEVCLSRNKAASFGPLFPFFGGFNVHISEDRRSDFLHENITTSRHIQNILLEKSEAFQLPDNFDDGVLLKKGNLSLVYLIKNSPSSLTALLELKNYNSEALYRNVLFCFFHQKTALSSIAPEKNKKSQRIGEQGIFYQYFNREVFIERGVQQRKLVVDSQKNAEILAANWGENGLHLFWNPWMIIPPGQSERVMWTYCFEVNTENGDSSFSSETILNKMRGAEL